MEKRFFLAITLSLAILLGYRYLLFSIYGPPPPMEPSHSTLFTNKGDVTTDLNKESYDKNIEREADDTVSTPILLENSKVRILLSPKEGAIQQIIMKEYRELGKPVELVKVEESSNFIGYMWFSSPKSDLIKYEIVEQNTLKTLFKGVLNEGLIVEKRVELSENDYTLNLSMTFRNQTGQTLPLYYQLTAASSLRSHEERFLEAIAFSTGKRKIFHLNGVLKKKASPEGGAAWGALKEKYFSLILKPEGEFSGFLVEPTKDRKNLALKIWSTPQHIAPGGEVTDRYLFYVGPNQLRELKKLGPWAEGVLHYGMFSGITKFLLWTLASINVAVKNYGLSIVILTIFVSILFLPLTGISYKSMKRMKLLQPEVEKIRQLYKNKPQKLNKEMMNLYKRNKVNPLGGCLPMLIQMPIFIAFYNALIHSIELKGASFLFIKDLSSPDHAIPLPFQFGPLGNAINLLPILMAIAMYIQQKLSTPLAGSGSDAQAQRMMATMMPFVFGFIFYGLPSGLVLYWLTNNIVMILTQKLLYRGTA